MSIYSLLFLLLSNAVTSKREKSILYSRITILILLSSFIISLKNLDMSFLSKGVGLYGGLFHATPITQVFHNFIFIVSAIILQLTAFYPTKVWIKNYASFYNLLFYKFTYDKNLTKTGQQFSIIEYPLIILFIILGGTFLVSASDIVSIFLSIELQSYGLYLLCTLYRNSELSTSAGLTYFLLGGLSSCFILLGTSLLYANCGTTNLDGYYIITGLSSIANEYTNNMLDCYKPFYINISLLIMSVGFLFKISAAPFHFWSPDVYDAIPTIVTTFVAIIAKISILIFLLELVHYTSNFYFAFNFSWTSGLLFSSFLSLIIGSVLGLTQFRIKRLFAYSTISHIGFILLAIGINSLESFQAFTFYLMQYSISNLNAFVLLISIGYSLYPFVGKASLKNQYNNLLDKDNSPVQLVSQLKGYYYINPTLALSLSITLFSFVGIPPLIGFFAKQMVLSAALDSNFIFLTLVAILTSVISAVYYLSIIKQIFFSGHKYKLNKNLHNTILHGAITPILNNKYKNKTNIIDFRIENLSLTSSLTITVSILTLILLLFILTPQISLNITKSLALMMFNP
uniref:NADH-ubiquinone oxidoreductase chain 2 n=1 Tax=Lecanora markjohnstonii TaxID=2217878 RepID=A0A2Z4KB52_9LECA|nr:NADH dehydrogenase subunit 2 [Lecanora markjohnstonii]